jgi:hypothetical protein
MRAALKLASCTRAYLQSYEHGLVHVREEKKRVMKKTGIRRVGEVKR